MLLFGLDFSTSFFEALFLLLVAFLTFGLIISHVLAATTPCPSYPPIAPAADVLADAGVQSALHKVKVLLVIEALLPLAVIAEFISGADTSRGRGAGSLVAPA